MHDTIKQLYNGEIRPCETLNVDPKEWHTACMAASAAREELDEKLDKETKAICDRFLLRNLELTGIELTQTFVNGFRIGASLMMEIMQKP